MEKYEEKVKNLFDKQEKLLTRENKKKENTNGIYRRYENPVLTAEHTPLIPHARRSAPIRRVRGTKSVCA